MQDGSSGSAQTQKLIHSRHSHHQTLENLAAAALAEGDMAAAFQLADRRLRIEPPPMAHCYVLRAEAAFRLGDLIGALDDLAAALKISPQDTAALRRLLAWGGDAERQRAASNLIDHDQDSGILRTCIEVLARAERRRLAVASIYQDFVTGWAVWDSDSDVEITLSADTTTLTYLLAPDPFHFLSRHPVRASAFRLPRSPSLTPQSLSISVQGERILQRRLPPNTLAGPALSGLRLAKHRLAETKPAPQLPATVIVPIYADHSATKACIDGLLADNLSGEKYHILLVNDATSDAAILRYLKSLSRYPHVEVLSNPTNLGFVGSVNRALAQLPHGDVLLLNADTLVPPGFVERLAGAARLSPDIGTVVPLSNNSEISDFPIPFHNNPLGSRDDVLRIDRIAASCNRGKVVDLPNGTGFCLYITRACLDAVGGLSESFHRGYLEDIDFCLRARERGFRNVCAPSVYVGHAGSRSFKSEKRTLVLRNLGVLEVRFPRFKAECAAFAATDPLRSARQAIEQNLTPPPSPTRPILIFCGCGALRDVAQQRARQLRLQGKPAILLEDVAQGGTRKVSFSAIDEQSPQSLSFGFTTDDELQDLERYLKRLRPSHCEIVDVKQVPASLVRLFGSLKLPFDLWMADATLERNQMTNRGPIMTTSASASDHSVQFLAANRDQMLSLDERLSRDKTWPDEIVSAARHVLVSTSMAASFAKTALRGCEAKISNVTFEPIDDLTLVDRSLTRSGPPTFVIVPTRSSSDEFIVIRHIADRLRRRNVQASIVVAGTTLDDLRLMSLENVFVTGEIKPEELCRALQAYNVQWMLTGFDHEPLFGHPLIELVRTCAIPVAYRDWSAGMIGPRHGDLAIQPDASPEQVAFVIDSWIDGN